MSELVDGDLVAVLVRDLGLGLAVYAISFGFLARAFVFLRAVVS